MDFLKEFSSPRSTAANPSGSDSKKNSQGIAIAERNDENCKPNNKELAENKPKNFMSMTLSSASKRKILAEKNDAALMNSSDANPGKNPQVKSNMTSQPPSEQICSFAHDNTPSADNSDPFPYDPLTNYTFPRPQFLRYNPDRRREILLRADGELRSLDESGSDSSPCYSPRKVVEESAPSFDSKLSIHDKEVEGSEEDDYDEDDNLEANEDEKPRKTWKLATLLFILIVWGLFIHSLNPGFDPSLQEYGHIGLAEDDNLAYYLNVPHGYVMGVMMGLSDVCLDMPRSESTCGIEDNSRESVVSKDPLSSEWQEEYSHFRDQEPPNGSELVIERDEDPHGNELVNKKDVDLFINDLEVVKENIHGVISFVDEYNRKSICKKLHIYHFAEQCYERDVAAEVHLTNSIVIHYFTSTSLRAAEIPLANARFANEQDGEQKLESFKTETETESEEKEHVMESAELAQRVSMVTTDDQGTDMDEILNTSGAKFNLGVFFTSSSKNFMQLLLLCFFLATVSFTCLYKYNLKCQRVSMQATKTPVFMKTSSASELGVDENISSTVSTQMGGNMIPCSDVHQKCLRNLTGDHGRFSSIKAPVVETSAKSPVVESGIKALAVESSIKAPVVELLGEFSIAKGPTSEIGSGQRFKRRDLNPEITLIDQSQKLSERMSCASEASLTTKFVSNASTTVQKQLSKEISGVRVEVRKTVDAPTPLRRSSRIRNRITSP